MSGHSRAVDEEYPDDSSATEILEVIDGFEGEASMRPKHGPVNQLQVENNTIASTRTRGAATTVTEDFQPL